MKIWTIASHINCIGKTTTAVTLATILSARDKKTLIIDLDPQGSMSRYFGLEQDKVKQSAYSLFENVTNSTAAPLELKSITSQTRIPQLHLLPTSPLLNSLATQMASQAGIGMVLCDALKRCEDHFEHVVIDCPTNLDILLVNALVPSDQVLIPVQTELLAFRGLEEIKHKIQLAKHTHKLSFEEIIIPTMFNRDNQASIDSLQFLQQNHADSLWEMVIPDDEKFHQASMIGLPLPLLEPQSKGALAYDALLDELLERELEAVE